MSVLSLVPLPVSAVLHPTAAYITALSLLLASNSKAMKFHVVILEPIAVPPEVLTKCVHSQVIP